MEWPIRESLSKALMAFRTHLNPNHFFLYEVWKNEDAFNKHEANATTREFRTKIQPDLGAPFDQRAHSKLE